MAHTAVLLTGKIALEDYRGKKKVLADIERLLQ